MKTLTLLIIIASLTLSTVFGQATETDYQKVRKLNDLAAKKRFVLSLSRDAQARLWRSHFAYVLITEDLTGEQEGFLVRALAAFDADDLTDELEQDAKRLFDADLGRRVFNPGPYDCRTGAVSIPAHQTAMRSSLLIPRATSFRFAAFSAAAAPFVDCNCRQTGTNWGCSGYCDPASCTVTPDGCSIFYLYSCNGMCNSGTKGD